MTDVALVDGYETALDGGEPSGDGEVPAEAQPAASAAVAAAAAISSAGLERYMGREFSGLDRDIGPERGVREQASRDGVRREAT
ncbi:hypothetical protein C6V83_01675 [Gordonia iterans]|uniref:Uncharacterized protein n=1 Tax=Gordonia iterans TaxID=1004901 RepID=A0A2S0KBX3_9ACTN|nr:hypothetical protein C6V83_01675 [Gordonia iterans]